LDDRTTSFGYWLKRRGDVDACTARGDEMLALGDEGDMQELSARGSLWRGKAMAAAGKVDAVDRLASAAATSGKIGRVRLEKDATEALAKVSGDATHRARAAAAAARIAQSARECEALGSRP
jgi:hypothetical protein